MTTPESPRALDWNELTRLTGGREFVVERVRLKDTGVAIEGSFELPPLAQLPAEDQLFIVAFVRTHGSIKRMEQILGVSYPTVKNRLNRLGESLEYAEVECGGAEQEGEVGAPPPSEASKALEALRAGHINVEEALKRLRP